ncbi:unnamed protein product [Haemonchus placei]|uniref:Uncharacterized protein n=1 Tax=Haemonchus placei TaxID=6290 RepID=A0A0N4X013_HAEPC|nr:unnamed protein product [Haemonchus placei]
MNYIKCCPLGMTRMTSEHCVKRLDKRKKASNQAQQCMYRTPAPILKCYKLYDCIINNDKLGNLHFWILVFVVQS